MQKIKQFISEHPNIAILAILLLVTLLIMKFYLLPYGLNSLNYHFVRLIIFFILFALLIIFFAKRDIYLQQQLSNIFTVLKIPPPLSNFAIEVATFLILILFIILSLIFPNRRVYDTVIIKSPTSDSISNNEPTPIPAINFTEGSYANIWVGSHITSNSAKTVSKHVTYTVRFSYQVNDQTRNVVKAEISDISIQTKLPSGKLYILPHSHVSQSANGGTIGSTQEFEDWNSFGYYTAADYERMPSLGTTYSPKICNADYSCDYNDEVARKMGFLGLRFKYIDVARSTNINTAYDIASHEVSYGISRNQMDATMSWKMKLTLDDGSVHEHNYSATVKGSDFKGTTNTSELVKF